MTSWNVTAEIGFALPPYEMLPESLLPERLAATSGLLGDLFELEGQLTLVGGSDEIVLGDILLSLVTRLCFHAPQQLAMTGEARVAMVATDEVVTLRRADDRILLEGIDQPAVELPAASAISALLDAGDRFVALARLAWPDEEEAIDALAAFGAAVRADLAAR